jgi:PTH1 family peptidyl-tRNA hydrolase
MPLKLPPQTGKIIMGLGNPGNQYVETRHNIGKRYINFLVKHLNLSFQPTKFGHFTFYLKDRMAIILFSSESFMNESGRAAKFIFDIADKKKEAELVVVHDDLDNDLGVFKIKDGGSPE